MGKGHRQSFRRPFHPPILKEISPSFIDAGKLQFSFGKRSISLGSITPTSFLSFLFHILLVSCQFLRKWQVFQGAQATHSPKSSRLVGHVVDIRIILVKDVVSQGSRKPKFPRVAQMACTNRDALNIGAFGIYTNPNI